MKATIYETITSQIVEAIDAGAETYRMPWHHSCRDIASPSNAQTGRSYRGVNTLALWMMAEARGFASGQWATYRQWHEQGAQVRKGEKAATIVFWKTVEASAAENAHDSEQAGRFVARAYSVFNADQVDGWTAPAVPMLPEAERIAQAEAFFATIPAQIDHGGNSACYIPTLDRVQSHCLDNSSGQPATMRPWRMS